MNQMTRRKGRKREMKELTLKVICGAVLSVIIFFGSMQHWFGFLQKIPRQAMLFSLFVLTAPPCSGWAAAFFQGPSRRQNKRRPT